MSRDSGNGDDDRVNPEPLSQRVFRFVRALVVGSGATLVDFSIFTTCIRVGGIAPTWARLPERMGNSGARRS